MVRYLLVGLVKQHFSEVNVLGWIFQCVANLGWMFQHVTNLLPLVWSLINVHVAFQPLMFMTPHCQSII